MKTSYKPKEKMTLPTMVRWWSRQSFTHDKGGSFNVQLYLKICEIKLLKNV